MSRDQHAIASIVSCMTLEFRRVTRDQMFQWQDAVNIGFMTPPNPATHAFREAVFDDQRTFATFDGDRIIGTYLSFTTPITVPGARAVPANAITAVTVLPSHQRRGVLAHAITTDLRAAKERGDIVALLLSSEYPIYGRFGFGVATEYMGLEIDVVGATITNDATDGGTVDLVTPDDAVGICKSLFGQYRANTPGAISRFDVAWERDFGLADDHPDWKWSGWVIVARDASGAPEGYVKYKADRNNWVNDRPKVIVTVNEFVGVNPAAERRLWTYLCNMPWVASIKVNDTRIDDDVRLLIDDQRRITQHGRLDHTWARALDVEDLLTTRTYDCAKGLVLEVVDQLGFANGRFMLETSEDGSSCVATDRAADLTLRVNELSSLAFGGASAEAFGRVGLIDEHTPGSVARADRLFRTSRAPWNPTHF